MNDLPNSVEHSKVMLYADDTAIMFSALNPKEIESTMNSDLDRVKSWLCHNKLSLNTDKTNFLLVGTPQKLRHIEAPIDIKIDGLQIRQVEHVKYLGVWLDQHLNWNEHMKLTSSKIASRLALLRRIRKYLTIDSAKLLANALVLPYFDYCCTSWSNCNQGLRDTLIKLHKQMARIVLQMNVLTPSSVLKTQVDEHGKTLAIPEM